MSEQKSVYDHEPLDEQVRKWLSATSTATLSTQMFKRGLRTRFMTNVSPLRAGHHMVGIARTLRYVPAREDLDTLATLGARTNAQRAVIEKVQRGEVLVIDGLRDIGAGSLGSILARRLQVRGAAGIVTDGAYRDAAGIARLELPSYAAGRNANTNLTLYHPADFDVVIGCGGVMVVPGDVVVGDDDGVIVIPRGIVEEIASDAFEQEQRESFIDSLVDEGACLFDVYPMNEETAQKYEAYRQYQGQVADRSV